MSRSFGGADVALISRKNAAFGATHRALKDVLFDSFAARDVTSPG